MRVQSGSLERVTSSYWNYEVASQTGDEALVRVIFSGRDVALFQLIAWSDCATVVEPAELRDQIALRARQALDLYGVTPEADSARKARSRSGRKVP